MSFFNWFAAKSKPASAESPGGLKRFFAGREHPAGLQPHRLAPQADSFAEGGKLKRYARREQLYVAIREAMTRAGVLSASYKFKVLSVDQAGDQFLVMMDVTQAFGPTAGQLTDIEALIVQNARARFEITVPAVYWRVDQLATVIKPPAGAQAAGQAGAPQGEASAVELARAELVKRAEARYEPIQADEVQAEAPDQRRSVCGGRRLQTLRLKLRPNKGVNGIADCGLRIADLKDRGPCDWAKRPVERVERLEGWQAGRFET